MPLPSEMFRKRLREVRRLRRWTQQDLAEELAAAGVEIGEFAVVRMERGPRGVSLDEAIAIAAVLGVSPLHMVVPPDDDTVQLTPRQAVSAADARAWLRGISPLREADEPLFYAMTPDTEADWLSTMPGPWRSEDPEVFKATRAKWERQILRDAMFPGERSQADTEAADIPVSRSATERNDQGRRSP